MANKDVQWKNESNRIVNAEYIRADVCAEDCPMGNDMYVATIPAGAIFRGMVATLTGQEDVTAKIPVKVDIGVNDCVFCASTGNIELSEAVASCNENCKCKVADQDYLVRVQFLKPLEQGCAHFYFEVILDHMTGCKVEPIKPCTTTVMADPCTGACPSCATDECLGDVGPALKVNTWADDTFEKNGPVTFHTSVQNVGDTVMKDVKLIAILDSAITGESASTTKGSVTATGTKTTLTVPELNQGEKAVVTYTGTGGSVDITITSSQPTATGDFKLVDSDLTDTAKAV